MSEMSFEDMLNESFKTIRTGEVVTGKVIDVKPESILLNIGYKSGGLIKRSDLAQQDVKDLPHRYGHADGVDVQHRDHRQRRHQQQEHQLVAGPAAQVFAEEGAVRPLVCLV